MNYLNQLSQEDLNAISQAGLVAIVDLDGTIANNDHRLHLVPKDKGTTEAWVAFNKACVDDPVIDANRYLIYQTLVGMSMYRMNQSVFTIYLTGRGNQARTETQQWLDANEFNGPLIMRGESDYRKADDFKQNVVTELLNHTKEIIMFDDDLSVVAMAQRLGIPSVLVPTQCVAIKQALVLEGNK